MEIKFLTPQRAQQLEDSISFLSQYILPHAGIQHVIGTSIEEKDIDKEGTEKLRRLAELNKERNEILQYFKTKSRE